MHGCIVWYGMHISYLLDDWALIYENDNLLRQLTYFVFDIGEFIILHVMSIV